MFIFTFVKFILLRNYIIYFLLLLLIIELSHQYKLDLYISLFSFLPLALFSILVLNFSAR